MRMDEPCKRGFNWSALKMAQKEKKLEYQTCSYPKVTEKEKSWNTRNVPPQKRQRVRTQTVPSPQ